MKLIYEYTFRQYDSRYMALADYEGREAKRSLLWVNDCGKTIIELLQKPLSRDELIATLADCYQGDVAVIAAAADAFIRRLAQEKLLTYATEQERALYEINSEKDEAPDTPEADSAEEPKLTEEFKELYQHHRKQIENCIRNTDEPERTAKRMEILQDALDFEKRTNFLAKEYFMYGFYGKSEAERLSYLPNSATKLLALRLNAEEYRYLSANKWEMYLRFKPFFHREVRLFKEINDEKSFFAYLKDKGALFCKLTYGSLGLGARIIKYKNVTDDGTYFHNLLKYYGEEGFVAEEVVKQSEFMMRLNPTSVNTLRVITVRLDDRICTYAFFRIGQILSVVDNGSQGGIVCGVDQQTGRILCAMDKHCNIYDAHPSTHIPLSGLTIPHFCEALALAKEMALVLPDLRYLSFDLAHTDHGWVMIEVNNKGNLFAMQQVLGRGMRKDFENYLSELGLPADFPIIREEREQAE